MDDSKISVRYSRALFESAIERKILDKVNQDMVLISAICMVAETREFLRNPVIVPSKKSEIFHKILDGKVEEITLSLIDLVVRNGRESFLPDIARVFIHERLKYMGITKSVLTTAVGIDSKLKEQIASLVSGIFNTTVELDEVVDDSIIGGFILRIDDNYIDASVRNKLNKIKKDLIRSEIHS